MKTTTQRIKEVEKENATYRSFGHKGLLQIQAIDSRHASEMAELLERAERLISVNTSSGYANQNHAMNIWLADFEKFQKGK